MMMMMEKSMTLYLRDKGDVLSYIRPSDAVIPWWNGLSVRDEKSSRTHRIYHVASRR